MKNNKRYALTNDVMFKSVFKEKYVIIDYLNNIFNLNITEDEISSIETEVNNEVNIKGARFDVRVIVRNELNAFDIEMQNQRPEYPMERRLFRYGMVQYVDLLKPGEEYTKDISSYVLCFVNYRFNSRNLTKTIYLFNEEENIRYPDLMIKMISLKELEKCANIELKRRFEILNTVHFENYENDKGVVGFMARKMMELNKDEQKRIAAESIEMSIINYNYELAAREKKGHEQGIKATAKNLLNEGMDIKFISKVTGLSIEEIEKLS